MKIKTLQSWINAFRLRTLPLAAAGIILGSAIAFSQASFRLSILLFALLTTFLLQILSNLANDYGDYSHGTDNEQRVGPIRTVQSGAISPKAMKIAMAITGLSAFLSGIILLYFAFGNLSVKFILFFITGLLSIAAAIKYTVGKSNFGYKGFGDIMVFIFFGPVAVWGVYFLHTLNYNWQVLLAACSIGLLSAGVLNVNNLRDHENDKASNKNTLVVKMGYKNGKVLHSFIILSAVLCAIIFLVMDNKISNAYWLFIPCLVLGGHLNSIWKTNTPADHDPELKRLALSTFLFAMVLSAIMIF